ncbi:MAG: hypothetical protein SH850_23195 [Planctomycetaceae bacterium]|nr:hypothetical protein [Planctomycetaceae bacterium]
MPIPPPALPRRVAWFAPWTWKPSKRWTLVGLVVVAYIESPVPLVSYERARPIWANPMVDHRIADTIWLPVILACEYIPGVSGFYDRQTEYGERLIRKYRGETLPDW